MVLHIGNVLHMMASLIGKHDAKVFVNLNMCKSWGIGRG
jgi:hypothetical protein